MPSGRACQQTFKAGQRIVQVVVLYCTAPKNGILIAAPTRKMKNFKMEYSVKSLPSLPTGRLDDTQLNWSVTADDDDHVHSSDVSRKRSYRVRLGSQRMIIVLTCQDQVIVRW